MNNTEEAILKEFDEMFGEGYPEWLNKENSDWTRERLQALKKFISQALIRVRESTLEEVMQKYEASIKQNMQDELVVTANFMISLKNMVKEQLNELRSNTK